MDVYFECLNTIRYGAKMFLRWESDPIPNTEYHWVYDAMEYLEDTIWNELTRNTVHLEVVHA